MLPLDFIKNENKLLFLWIEVGESKLVKLETSRTVRLPTTVSDLCIINFEQHSEGSKIIFEWPVFHTGWL